MLLRMKTLRCVLAALALGGCDRVVSPVGAQTRATAARPAGVTVSFPPPSTPTPLLPRRSSWRIAPDPAATPPAGAAAPTTPAARPQQWFEPAFDDSAWTWGRPRLRPTAAVPAAPTPAANDEAPPPPVPQTAAGRFRKHFTITDRGAFTGIVLRVLRGDGVIL